MEYGYPVLVPVYRSGHVLSMFLSHNLCKEKNTPMTVHFMNQFDGPYDGSYLYKMCEENDWLIHSYTIDDLPRNANFTYCVNRLFEKYVKDKKDSFTIMNPDAYAIDENWLTNLISSFEELLEKYPEMIITGSMHFHDWHKRHLDQCGTTFIDRVKLGWRTNGMMPHPRMQLANGKVAARVEGHGGSGLIIPTDKFVELGMLDEKYPGYGSDSDFCVRAESAGYIFFATDVSFYHRYGQSTGDK